MFFSYFLCSFSILYVLHFCIFCVFFLLLYIAVSFLFLYKFTDHCQLEKTQLQYINIVSCHITCSVLPDKLFRQMLVTCLVLKFGI